MDDEPRLLLEFKFENPDQIYVEEICRIRTKKQKVLVTSYQDSFHRLSFGKIQIK